MNESAVQPFSLVLPAEIAPGEYLVAMGIYESQPPYTRLPRSTGGGESAADYLPLGTLRVEERGQ